MKALAGGKVHDYIFKPFFMKRLPNQVQFVLSGSNESTNMKIEKADYMIEYANEGGGIAAIYKSPSDHKLTFILMQQQKPMPCYLS